MRRLWTVECQPPWLPFFPASEELADTTTRRLPATWRSLNPTLQVRPLSQRGTTRLWHKPFLHIEIEPSLQPGFATSLRGKDWDKPMENCCWVCGRDQFIWPYSQASLGGTTSLRLWRKGNCEAQTSWHCLEAELKTCTKIQAELPNQLDTALSRMSWTWYVIHTLLTQE